MNDGFRLFPDSASTFAEGVDRLFIFLVAVALFFTALICVLILAFGVRFRRGSPARRLNPPVSKRLELLWGVVPFILTMVMFGWGAVLFFDMRTPPDEDLIEIEVVGKQWMWRIQHPNGRREINELHVPLGEPVRLRMISEDVIHSFYVPAFRVKQDVLPGYYTSLWFEANQMGEFHLFCAEYCGTEHSQMRGSVIVMEPRDYAGWLAGETGDPPEVVGRRLFEQYRCANCHKHEGGGTGPSLVGVYNSTVPLTEEQTVVADEQYLRDSILDPANQVVAGYQPLMPVYRDLSESQILALIAYIRSLTIIPPQELAPE